MNSNSFSNKLMSAPFLAALAGKKKLYSKKQHIIIKKLLIFIDELLVAPRILTMHVMYAGTI